MFGNDFVTKLVLFVTCSGWSTYSAVRDIFNFVLVGLMMSPSTTIDYQLDNMFNGVSFWARFFGPTDYYSIYLMMIWYDDGGDDILDREVPICGAVERERRDEEER